MTVEQVLIDFILDLDETKSPETYTVLRRELLNLLGDIYARENPQRVTVIERRLEFIKAIFNENRERWGEFDDLPKYKS